MLSNSVFCVTALLSGALLIGCSNQSNSGDGGAGSKSSNIGSGESVSLLPEGGSASLPVAGSGATSLAAEDTVEGWTPIETAKVTALMSDPDTACSGWAEEPESSGCVIEFVVDVSGSMDKTSPGTNGETKWVVSARALKAAIKSLPQGLPVGLTFFPNMPLYASELPRPTAACVDTKDNVAIAPLDAAQRDLLLTAIDGVQMNRNGATPTHDA